MKKIIVFSLVASVLMLIGLIAQASAAEVVKHAYAGPAMSDGQAGIRAGVGMALNTDSEIVADVTALSDGRRELVAEYRSFWSPLGFGIRPVWGLGGGLNKEGKAKLAGAIGLSMIVGEGMEVDAGIRGLMGEIGIGAITVGKTF